MNPSTPLGQLRTFGLLTLLGLIVLNCFLAYSGQSLATQMRRAATHEGIQLSSFSQAALASQPAFYLVASAALVTVTLGFGRRFSEHLLIYVAFCLLVLDITGLLVSLWGFSSIHFLLH